MSGPRFAFQVHVDALIDQVPGSADQRSLVSTSPQVSIAGAPAMSAGASTFVYETTTDWPGPVPVQMLVVRHTQPRSVSGSIQKQGGHWHWSGGGHSVPLSPDDPCVTRVWPGGRGMTDHEFAIFCKTRIVEAPVPPGIVGTVNFTYDLASDQIAGDVHGPAGTAFDVPKDLSLNGRFDLRFTVTSLDARGFARDVRPLFRDKDIQSMRFAFDLSSYADVQAHASEIYNAVSVVCFTSPAPPPGSAARRARSPRAVS